jgi:hypothetical protein
LKIIDWGFQNANLKGGQEARAFPLEGINTNLYNRISGKWYNTAV